MPPAQPARLFLCVHLSPQGSHQNEIFDGDQGTDGKDTPSNRSLPRCLKMYSGCGDRPFISLNHDLMLRPAVLGDSMPNQRIFVRLAKAAGKFALVLLLSLGGLT